MRSERLVLAVVVVITSFALALILLYVYQRSLVTELRTRAAAERTAIDALAREMVLRQNEERFRLFIEAVQDYAMFTLDAEGRVSSWNKGAERLKGYAASEIIGKHFSCFYPEEDRAIKPPIELAGAISDGQFKIEAGEFAKMAHAFGPMWCLLRCETIPVRSLVLPRLRATLRREGKLRRRSVARILN